MSISVQELQSCYISQMMLELFPASVRLRKHWIPPTNRLLDGISCKNFFDFHLFIFIGPSIKILSYTLSLLKSQLQAVIGNVTH